MTTIKIDYNNLLIEIEGINKILSLKSKLTIPLTHILSVSQRLDEAKKWLGIKGLKKIAGANLPGIISEGTFYDKGRIFLDIHHPEKTISIFLKDEKYKEIIIEVDNPKQVIDEIKNSL